MFSGTQGLASWLMAACRREPVDLLVSVLSTMVFVPLAVVAVRFAIAVWWYLPLADALLIISVLVGAAGLSVHLTVATWRYTAENVSRATRNVDDAPP